MINLIKTQDITIDMTPPSIPSNFFPIESAILIIGENGTGKTSLLKEICLGKNTEFYWSPDCQQNKRSKPLMLYFNPVARSKIGRDSSHLRDISNLQLEIPERLDDSIFGGVFKKAAYAIDANSTKAAKQIIQLLRDCIKNLKEDGHNELTPLSRYIAEYTIKEISSTSETFREILIERYFNNLSFNFIANAWSSMTRLDFIALFHTLNSRIGIEEFSDELLACFAYFTMENAFEFEWMHSRTYYDWMFNRMLIESSIEEAGRHEYIGRDKIRLYDINPSAVAKGIFTCPQDSYSSGQFAILRQFSNIYNSINVAVNREHILLLIDEGDALLHVEWQAEYINSLMNFLCQLKLDFSGEIKSLQVILTTHSPVVASDFPKELIIQLGGIIPRDIKTFATPIDALISGCLGSKAIGDFAARKIRSAYAMQKNGQSYYLEYIQSITDNPVIKSAIQSILSKEKAGDY